MRSPATLRRLRRRLLAWFHRHQRPLPWRRDRDPYRIWVSEVMLQQTQVATVIPYFERFIERFPTLRDLAAADEHDVLRAWEGLGYYRRARDLHRAARIVTGEYQGQIPADAKVFAALPGVGRYMVGAVLSQAYGRPLPILEANSERVLCRLLGLREDPRSASGRLRLWQMAEELVCRFRPGDLNQAIMELGATVCTRNEPKCDQCPARAYCRARQAGLQAEIPLRSARPDVIQVEDVAIVARRRGQVFLVQRPATGRWANMWEFPRGELRIGERHEEAAARIFTELTGLEASVGPELCTIRHTVTNHRITLIGFLADRTAGRFHSDYYQQGRWVALPELSAYALSKPQRRLAELLQKGHQQHLF